MGKQALYQNTTGSANTAVGAQALFNSTAPFDEVAIGDSALYNDNSGNGFNTAIGYMALFANTYGSSNTLLATHRFKTTLLVMLILPKDLLH